MIIDVEQKSAEWLLMRVGSCTASRVGDVIAKLQVNAKSGKKGEPKACRGVYLREIVCERLTGLSADHYVSQYMENGMDWEPLARAAYEMHTGQETADGGYATHPRIKNFGASPDFLCGDDGCGEIKCLKAENHLAIIEGGNIPDEFLPQMTAELACTDRLWNDFVSYNKDFPKHMRLFVRRLERTPTVNETIAAIEAEVRQFLSEVDEKINQLDKLANGMTLGMETA